MKQFRLRAIIFISVGLLVASTVAPAQQAVPPDKDTGPIRLILPPVIYATPGIESNLYFRNTVLVINPDNYAFEVDCKKGRQFQERWAFTPEPDDAGESTFTLTVFDQFNNVVARGSSVLRIAPIDAGAPDPVTMLIFGASITQASVYPQHLLDLAEEDPHLSLRLIGSRGARNKPADGELRHEGYNGWGTGTFANHHGPLSRTGQYKRPQTGSPFVFEDAAGKPVLDFQRYYDQLNQGQSPDYVMIQLGPNDILRGGDDTVEQNVDRSLHHYDQLLNKIHEADPDTKIGVMLVNPPSPSSDGFRIYARSSRQTAWQYTRNHHRFIERLVEHYGNRTDQHIYLVPSNINLDTEHGYPTRLEPRHSRSTEKVMRVINATHPTPEGYRQMGDPIYAWLKVTLSE